MLDSRSYDIELIDVNENVDNFTFERVPKSCLEKVLMKFKEKQDFLEFTCSSGNILLVREFFRGIMYVPHVEREKSVKEENFEAAEEISKIAIVNKNKPKVVSKR